MLQNSTALPQGGRVAARSPGRAPGAAAPSALAKGRTAHSRGSPVVRVPPTTRRGLSPQRRLQATQQAELNRQQQLRDQQQAQMQGPLMGHAQHVAYSQSMEAVTGAPPRAAPQPVVAKYGCKTCGTLLNPAEDKCPRCGTIQPQVLHPCFAATGCGAARGGAPVTASIDCE